MKPLRMTIGALALVLACSLPALGESGVSPLDVFSLGPAPFYTTAEGRPATFAARNGLATWLLAVRLPEPNAGKLVKAELSFTAGPPEGVPSHAIYIAADAEKKESGIRAGMPDWQFIKCGQATPPAASQYQMVMVLLHAAGDIPAGTYTADLSVQFERGAASTPLALRILPFELPPVDLKPFLKDEITPAELLETQRVESNRYADVLRLRGAEAEESNSPIFYSLGSGAMKERSAIPIEAKDLSELRFDMQAVERSLRPAGGESRPSDAARAASFWDLLRWRSAWLYMRLSRAAAGFDVVRPERDLTGTVKLSYVAQRDQELTRPLRAVCPIAAAAPDIDGELSEECWAKAGTADSFTNVSPETDPRERITQIRFCHDAQNLYIGLIAGVSPPELLRLPLKPLAEYTPEELARRETVSISLYPLPNSRAAINILLDPFGTCIVESSGIELKGRVEPRVVVRKFARHWTAELAIPVRPLPVKNDWWGVFALRTIPAQKVFRYVWPSAKGAGRGAFTPADLVFYQPECTITRFDLPGLSFGPNSAWLTLRNSTARKIFSEVYFAVKFSETKVRKFSFPLPELPPGKFVRVELPFKLTDEGGCSLALSLRDTVSGAELARIVRLGEKVPAPLQISGQLIFTREEDATFVVTNYLAEQYRNRIALHLVLTPASEQKKIGELYVNSLKSMTSYITFPIKDLDQRATYTLNASIVSEEGAISNRAVSFALFPHFLDPVADGR